LLSCQRNYQTIIYAMKMLYRGLGGVEELAVCAQPVFYYIPVWFLSYVPILLTVELSTSICTLGPARNLPWLPNSSVALIHSLPIGSALWLQSGWLSSGWLSSGWLSSGWLSSGWPPSDWPSSGWPSSGWSRQAVGSCNI
jgi:hypothetical protein